jgi:hypothetical protein
MRSTVSVTGSFNPGPRNVRLPFGDRSTCRTDHSGPAPWSKWLSYTPLTRLLHPAAAESPTATAAIARHHRM